MTKTEKTVRFTYKAMLEDAIQLFELNAASLPNGGADHIDSAKRLIERLTNKNSGEKKLSENQKQAMADAEVALDALKNQPSRTVGKTMTKGLTITEITRAIPDFDARRLSVQYVTSVMRRLTDSDKVGKETISGRTYFFAK